MNDFEIDIIDKEVTEHDAVQLPVNYLLIGELENDDVKVYIKQNVYKALEEYALSNVSLELGTIILGNYSDMMGKMNVVISEFIYAKYTDSSASTLTFTHETWDYVHKEHEENHPNTKIVGWQHTHPGYGIFLSNYDMFIQENFFNMPFQVAYVIDPLQHIRGFFQWKNGKVEKLKGFYIYDEVGKQIKFNQPKEKKNAGSPAGSSSMLESKFSFFQPLILGSLCLIVIGLLISSVSLNKRYNRQIEEQEAMELQIAEQNMLISQQASELEYLKRMTNKTEIVESIQTEETSKEENSLETDVETDKTSGEEYDENILEDTTEVNAKNQEEMVYFIAYKVVPGDNLSAICKKNNLDYSSDYRIILSLNGIEDANQIYVGQTILLPVCE